MEKVSGFQITGMQLSGFKSFSQTTELTFGNPTVITGGNGRGKSSIADAIAFAITGVPFFGEKRIDRMHSEDNPNLHVSLSLVDDMGVAHELIRSRNAGRTTVSFDGRELRQMDLTEMFGEKDVFLSIFNPLYFIEELGDDGKNLLQRHLPALPPETVLAELSESVRAVLTEEELRAPDSYVKRLRQDIREQESAIIYLQGQQDLVNTQTANGQSRLAELQKTLETLREEKKTLETKRYAGMDKAELESRLTELSAQYSDMASDRSDENATEELDQRLLELARKLAETKAAVYESKFTQPIAEAAERVKALGAKYTAEVQVGKAIVPGFVCPACRRAVSEGDLPAVRKSFQESVSSIIAEGKEQRAQLEELRGMDTQSRETFETFKAEDIAKIEAALTELTEKRGKVLAEANHATLQRHAQMAELRTQMQNLTSDLEYGRLSGEEYERLHDCKNEISRVEAEISALQNTAFPSAEEFEAKITAAQEQITKLKERVNCLLQYISKRVELTLSQLRMNRVSISLYDVVKSTGEVKDVFRFEYNGRRYDRLSLSEKIRAGMEVSELMKHLTGRNYPVFVDNMESVDDLNNVRPSGQVLMAKCVSNTELNVRPVKPILTEMPMAA